MYLCGICEQYERWIARLAGGPLTPEDQGQLLEFLQGRHERHGELDNLRLEGDGNEN